MVITILATTLISLNAAAQTYKTTEPVNLREKPDSKSPIMRTLDKDELVEKIGSSGDFLEVKTNRGEHGYVWGDYLKKTDETETRVITYQEFLAALEKRPGAPSRPGPGLYYFESILEYLRLENHPIFVIGLPLLVALGIGISGVFLGMKSYASLVRIIPVELDGGRRLVVKWVMLVAFFYLFAKALLYFMDLALHYASLEENSVLVLILACPRLLMAGPVTAIDLLAGNWVISIFIVLVLGLILIPGLRKPTASEVLEEGDSTIIEDTLAPPKHSP
jgi:uncharacterized protein YgiM (DUF1202 family)